MHTLMTQEQLSTQLKYLNKTALIDAVKELGYRFEHNLKKEKYADELARGILQALETGKSNNNSFQVTIVLICRQIKGPDVPNLLRRLFIKQTGQTVLPKQQPNPGIRRSNNQIQNQKSHLKCLCNGSFKGEEIECIDCEGRFHTFCLKIPKN